MEQFVYKNHKKLRYGYTTGSCAAAASKAAAAMLLSGKEISYVELHTPKGIDLRLEVLDISREDNAVSCAIQKDGGDDPDVTNGILIYAKVSREPADEAQIIIDGGIGVGRVTKPGLEQPVGAAAINKVPRQMIRENLEAVCEQYHYHGKLSVVISIPSGVELAAKTFNPRLGIVGGISVLGTSGIVEPMSEQALISSIQVEMKQKSAGDRKYLLIAPGNYGLQYLSGNFTFEAEEAVKCSNYVGQTIDFAVNMGLKGVLFVAHIGKFIKVAGGIMNTHSREADARMEIMAACALRAGADADTANRILVAVTTDEGLSILKETPYWAQTMQIITEKVEYYLNHRAQGRLEIGAVLYSNAHGELGRTSLVEQLLEQLQEQKSKEE